MNDLQRNAIYNALWAAFRAGWEEACQYREPRDLSEVELRALFNHYYGLYMAGEAQPPEALR